MVQLLLPKNQVFKIRYFTALVNSRPRDPDQPLRQQIYSEGIKTIPNLEIILGHFLSHEISMPLANCPPGQQQYVKVIKTEEKGSDVNIATHLLHDGYKGAYEVAVVISNDFDLVEAIKNRPQRSKKGCNCSQSIQRYSQPGIKSVCHFRETDPARSPGCQSNSQVQLKDQNGSFYKPPKW